MKAVLILAVGFMLLVWGAEWFVRGASALARKMGVSPLIIGLTVVAFGTSMPELAVSVTAALEGSDAIALGNVIGSNIFNLLGVVGISAMMIPVAVHPEIRRRDLPWAVGTTVLLFAMMATDGIISRVEGAAFLALFTLLTVLQIRAARRQGSPKNENVRTPWFTIVYTLVIGLASIIAGGHAAVGGATALAHMFGWSESLIGLTIVAIGTSLPELCTSVTAARHGESEIAVGNVVGSNLFNVMFILGIAGVIQPLPVAGGMLVDAAILLVCTALFMIPARRGKVSRLTGIIMMLGYVAYTAFLIMR